MFQSTSRNYNYNTMGNVYDLLRAPHYKHKKTPYSQSTGQRLDRGIAVPFSTGPEFLLLSSVHTGSVAHPKATGKTLPGGKVVRS